MKLSNSQKKWLAWGGGVIISGAVSYLVTRLLRRGKTAGRELRTVSFVDINRYMGKWYEIARYPVAFEKNCYNVTAEYMLRPDGRVSVTNYCNQGSAIGPLRADKGIAWVADPSTNARLKVQFVWPFSGDYWIIDLGINYDYAVVGSPDRSTLWVLNRTPIMDEGTYNWILKKVEEQGFDTTKLIKTPQEQPQPEEVGSPV